MIDWYTVPGFYVITVPIMAVLVFMIVSLWDDGDGGLP